MGEAGVIQRVDPDQVKRASFALLRHLQEQESKRQIHQLIEEDEFISLIITLKYIPTERKAKPFQIPLVHSIAPENQEVCVFIKDGDEERKSKLLEIPGVSKVISLTKLRKNYKSFEAKRKLAASYDLFVTDDRIVTFMPSLLGKAFYEKKRNPIPISLSKNIAKQISKIQTSTLLFVNTGVCLNVKVGRSTFTAEQITENIMAALPKIIEKLPKKWTNVQALHIKSSSSVSLAIYNSLPDAELVAKKVRTEKRKVPEASHSPPPAVSDTTPKKSKTTEKTETPKKTKTPVAVAEETANTPKRAKTTSTPAGTPKARVSTPRPTLKSGTPKTKAH